MTTDYYQILELSQTASQQEIKQSYKRLALKYHPDKNADKQIATVKFRQLSEAYSILNDPQKRARYDQYGVLDADFDDMNFQQFMHFGQFQQFLEDILQMNTFQDFFEEMMRTQKKRGAKGRGRVKNRANKNSKNNKGFTNLMKDNLNMDTKMESALFEALLKGQQIDLDDLMGEMNEKQLQKELEKMIFEDDSDEDEDEDEEDLTEQQLKILEFGQKHVYHKKVGKKKKKSELRCKFDQQKVEKDEILLHFSDKHMKQFREWEESGKNGEKINEMADQQIQY